MSFLRRLFGTPRPDKLEYLRAMTEMASESERTYRGMIETYTSDVALGVLPGAPASPTGRGLYKARVFGALFMAAAYARVAESPADAEEFVNAATGLALEPLQGPAAPSFDRAEAAALVPYVTRVFKAVISAYGADPFVPGSTDPAHVELAEPLHEALADSIGEAAYTTQVRERFEIMVQGNAASALAHSAHWASP